MALHFIWIISIHQPTLPKVILYKNRSESVSRVDKTKQENKQTNIKCNVFLDKGRRIFDWIFVAYKPGTRLEKTAFSLSYSVNFALMTPHVFLLFLHFIFLFICLFQTISNELQLLKLQIYFLGYSFSDRFISMFEKCGEKREIKFVQAFYCACQEFNCLL